MKFNWNILAVLCAGLSIAGCGYFLASLRNTSEQVQDQAAYRDRVAEQVRRYRVLSARDEDTIFGSKPQADIETRMAEALRAARVHPIPSYAVSVQADRAQPPSTASAHPGMREQQISIRVPALELRQIGDLLVHWVAEQAVWVPRRIELTHDARSTENRYTLHLECAAVYHAAGEE